jgi:hypothetical protein
MKAPNHPPVVYVEWMDSHGASQGWTELDEAVEFGMNAISGPIASAGFLIAENEAGIVVASGFNPHANDVVGAMAIPRSAIARFIRLRAARGMEQVP